MLEINKSNHVICQFLVNHVSPDFGKAAPWRHSTLAGKQSTNPPGHQEGKTQSRRSFGECSFQDLRGASEKDGERDFSQGPGQGGVDSN